MHMAVVTSARLKDAPSRLHLLLRAFARHMVAGSAVRCQDVQKRLKARCPFARVTEVAEDVRWRGATNWIRVVECAKAMVVAADVHLMDA